MQICQLSAVEGARLRHSTFLPDCHLHGHLSKKDANELAAAGRVAFVSERAVVVAGPSSLSGYWYDKVAKEGTSDRYWGTAQSRSASTGSVGTRQLVNFMPREIKHKVTDIAACGRRRRRMSAAAINGQPGSLAANGE